ASAVARMPRVREVLVARQRRIGESGGIVMEGRDIGTVVFPDADVKIYLDASAEERARRRLHDPAHSGGQAGQAGVAGSLGALGLLAAGIALAYARSHPRYSQGFGALVVAIAAVAAVGYATKTDFGFGDLPEGLARGAGTLPGLPAPNSILAFVLIGSALVVL